MANDRFLGLFFEEARELLQGLESGLMDLEARQGDRAHLDRTFRAAHTLKGAAGMVGLAAIARFTHGVEAVLDRLRNGQLAVGPEVISALLASKDFLVLAVESEAEGRPVAPDGALLARLEAVLQAPAAVEASPPPIAVPEPEPEPELRHYVIRLTPARDVLRRGVNPSGMLDELRDLGVADVRAGWDAVPALEDLDPLDCHLSWTIDLRTGADLARIEEVFLFLGDPGQVAIREAAEEAPATPGPAPAAGAAIEAPKAPPSPATRVRVDAGQLDELVGMAGELAVLTDGLQGLADLRGAGPWVGAIEALERVGRRLREATLELRMVPVEELFIRFPRVVRDLADKTGKRVALRVEGEETRLDRAIVERLSEPMIHLIRNAIDHGLESPDERNAAGKPPVGRLTIGAGHEGDRVAIRVSDDGRGLDRARIVRKGVAAGLVPPGTSPDDPKVASLIFEAGFSTRDKAGELSGRGVGLDVVRDAIRALRGTVSLRSNPGLGTTFTIHLPLTLAMIDGLLVEADGGRYVVPMGQVEECIAASEEDEAWMFGHRAAKVRGELVPLVNLGAEGQSSGRRELLLTRFADRRVGVAVDRLLGRVRAVIQPLDEGLVGLRRYSGATILGDGSVCLILDLSTLVAESQAPGLFAHTTDELSPRIAPEPARSIP